MAAAWASVLALTPDQRRELGERARERVTARFPLDGCVQEYLALYRTLLPTDPADGRG